MRIFISYAHVDWQFVGQLANRLRRFHDVWFDESIHAGQDWWQTILEQLDWCECFVYVLSPESLASEYCRKEYDEARGLEKYIVPVRLQTNIELPDTLQHIQYSEFATRLFEDALADLIGELGRLELQIREQKTLSPTKRSHRERTPVPKERFDEKVTFTQAINASQAGEHETALRLFKAIVNEAPNFLSKQVAKLIADTERELEKQARRKEYDRIYSQVSLLFLDPRTLEDAQELWAELQRDFPDIEDDPYNLAKRYATEHDQQITQALEISELNFIVDILPSPFEWCEVPAGRSDIDGQVFRVNPFFVSKYPITYAQFQVFIDALDGYYNETWWQGLAKIEGQPGNQRWRINDHPRENISWYDAVTFCDWLTANIGYEVRLPTEWEWQWAAQGREGWTYPWGNRFSKSRSNTRMAGIKKTTPIDEYPSGASPFGVMDMIGNVWEWCLNEFSDPEKTSRSGSSARVIRGGSWKQEYKHLYSRKKALPQSRSNEIGFRVICGSPPLNFQID
jgi:tetratricopeptide (TPR) repeat protein